jgi:hypothetical protein
MSYPVFLFIKEVASAEERTWSNTAPLIGVIDGRAGGTTSTDGAIEGPIRSHFTDVKYILSI